MAIKKADVVWNGSLREGGGKISTETGVLKGAPYGFKARFENGPGTNPEELIGAAHAGCFTMALAAALGKEGFTPDEIKTSAAVHLMQESGGFAIPRIELTTRARVAGIDAAKFAAIAENAKKTCPVSKALTGVPSITLDAALV